MKELSVIEMNDVSGAYSWDFSSIGSTLTSIVGNTAEAVYSAAYLGIHAGWTGSILGGKYGGNGGGIFGIGSFGALVGFVGGGIFGTVGGAINGAIVGWDESFKRSGQLFDSIAAGSI